MEESNKRDNLYCRRSATAVQERVAAAKCKIKSHTSVVYLRWAALILLQFRVVCGCSLGAVMFLFKRMGGYLRP